MLFLPSTTNEGNFHHWSSRILLRMNEISVNGVVRFYYEWSKFPSLEFSTFPMNERNFRHWCSRLRLQRKEFASLHFSALSLESRNFLLISSFSYDHFQEKVLKILSNIFEKQEQECSNLKLIKTKHVHDWQVKMDTFSFALSG